MTVPTTTPPSPASAADIAAVVVTHQSASTIDDCLARLRAADGVGVIRVVDNQSDDGTLEIAQRHATADPRVRFIANPDNPGFAVACNQGAADALAAMPAARWVALVNPDAMVEADSLAALRALAAPRGEVLLGADLVGEDGVRDPAARRRDPDFGAMLRALLPGRPASGLSGGGKSGAAKAGGTTMAVAPDDNQELQQVAAISGALMFVSRSLFERLGGFDPDYRLHAEDLDLCRRAFDAGAFIAVANQVRVMHVRGVSSRSRPLFVEWHKHRGLWRYFGKFEADQRGPLLRAGVFVAIWLRFPLSAGRAWLKSRQLRG